MNNIWLAVDKNGEEFLYAEKPRRNETEFRPEIESDNPTCLWVPNGTIKVLLGRELTWKDEPVKRVGEKEIQK